MREYKVASIKLFKENYSVSDGGIILLCHRPVKLLYRPIEGNVNP